MVCPMSYLLTEKEKARLERKLVLLRQLHPDYTEDQIHESYANLVHYFDLVWKIFVRMRADGTLDRIFDNSKETP